MGDAAGYQRALRSANSLILSLRANERDLLGWPYVQRLTRKSAVCGIAGSIDPFGDGTCNPPETPYMLQTGYAIACLAQLGILANEESFIILARRVITDSWSLGAAPLGCEDCFYYWYSYHENDYYRFVRNTNLAMGFGLVWLYAATGEDSYRVRALAIAKSEVYELENGNFGYFGLNDPRYQRSPLVEADRVENHVVHQINGLRTISVILGDAKATNSAQQLLDRFLDCDNSRCRRNDCASWAAPISCKTTATIAPCALADVEIKYRNRCNKVMKVLPMLNAFQKLVAFGPRAKVEIYPPAN
jgi:hypothetical protein